MPAIRFPPYVGSSDDIIRFMAPSRTYNLIGSILVERLASKVVFLIMVVRRDRSSQFKHF